MPAEIDPMQVTLLAVSCSAAALQHWDLIQRQKQPQAPVWRQQHVTQVPGSIAPPLLRELLPQVLDILSDAVLAPSNTSERPAAKARADAACSLLGWLLQHTPATAQHNNTFLPSASDRGATLLAAAAWRKQAPKLGTVLEALVRAGPGCSLEPILQSSTRYGFHFSDQTACGHQGSCLQLLLDAAVAAKLSEAQLQHCSLLVSLLKHGSTGSAKRGLGHLLLDAAVAAKSSEAQLQHRSLLSLLKHSSTPPIHSASAPSPGSSSSASTTADQGHAGDSNSPGAAESHGSNCAAAQPASPWVPPCPSDGSCPPLPRYETQAGCSLCSWAETISGFLDKLHVAWHGSSELPVAQPRAPLAAADTGHCLPQTQVPRMPTNNQTNTSSSYGSPCAEPPVADEAIHVLLAAMSAVIAVLSANWQSAAAAHSSPNGSGSQRGSSDNDTTARAGSRDGGGITTGNSCKGGSSSCAVGHAAVTCVLQSALVSRCCMVCAEHLQRLSKDTLTTGTDDGPGPHSYSSHSGMASCWVDNRSSDSASSSRLQGASNGLAGALLIQGVVNLLDACTIWASLNDRQQPPLPAGYDAAAVRHALQEANHAHSSALNASWDAFNGKVVQTAPDQLADSLAVLGRTLGAVATPLLCNNPCCSNLTGSCELHLVDRGKQKICAKCQTSRFCSVDCQRSHHKRHKRVCWQLAAACSAAAAEVPSGPRQLSHS